MTAEPSGASDEAERAGLVDDLILRYQFSESEAEKRADAIISALTPAEVLRSELRTPMDQVAYRLNAAACITGIVLFLPVYLALRLVGFAAMGLSLFALHVLRLGAISMAPTAAVFMPMRLIADVVWFPLRALEIGSSRLWLGGSALRFPLMLPIVLINLIGNGCVFAFELQGDYAGYRMKIIETWPASARVREEMLSLPAAEQARV